LSLGVGIIGVGGIARAHMEAYRQIPEAVVWAVLLRCSA
jgi:hypothetical protein